MLGRRDRCLLLFAIQTGLRVSELIGLRQGDIYLGRGAHVRCEGKGRKQRCTPLTRTTGTGSQGMSARTGRNETKFLFPALTVGN
jgi:integrase